MFNNNSLSLNDYLKKNKEALDGEKFCNGMCLKYLHESEFFEKKGNCKNDINALTHLLRGISADLIKLAIVHYKIFISSEERKIL